MAVINCHSYCFSTVLSHTREKQTDTFANRVVFLENHWHRYPSYCNTISGRRYVLYIIIIGTAHAGASVSRFGMWGRPGAFDLPIQRNPKNPLLWRPRQPIKDICRHSYLRRIAERLSWEWYVLCYEELLILGIINICLFKTLRDPDKFVVYVLLI